MKIDDIYEIYDLIANSSENFSSRKKMHTVRKQALAAITPTGLVKVAFDTRRVNQETDYIPRRGLQNYHRSEKFISDEIAIKIEAFKKLNSVLEPLKIKYGREPEWQDSYTRILESAITKGLRTDQNDGDFSDVQPSMGSLAYLEELLYVRYRLTPDSLMSMSSEELSNVILRKDDLLSKMTVTSPPMTILSELPKFGYEQMMNKMLETMAQMIAANKQQEVKIPEIQTTKDGNEKNVTITIKV
jgi:hypothetical protein